MASCVGVCTRLQSHTSATFTLMWLKLETDLTFTPAKTPQTFPALSPSKEFVLLIYAAVCEENEMGKRWNEMSGEEMRATRDVNSAEELEGSELCNSVVNFRWAVSVHWKLMNWIKIILMAQSTISLFACHLWRGLNFFLRLLQWWSTGPDSTCKN